MHALPLAQFLADIAHGGSQLLREAKPVRRVPAWAEERQREANGTRAECAEQAESEQPTREGGSLRDDVAESPWPDTELLAKSYRLARYMSELHRAQSQRL